jgi:TRAP transporter TAXI family solute receptor
VKRLFATALVAISLGLNGQAAAQPLGLGTSPQGTLTYGVGAAVSKALADAANIQSRVQPSSGTGTMIPLVNSGEIDMGFANTLELYDAFHGVGTFDKRPNPKLRTVAVIFPIKVGLFVRADSPIRSVKDLKGKTIAYGFTSQEIIKKTVDAMLATGGLSVNDLRPVLVPNLIRGVDDFMAGRVDVTTFAIGSAKVSEADASVNGIRFLPMENSPAALAALKKEFPTAYLDKVDPAPNFAGVKEPIVTMLYDYTVFANADMPAERVKTVARIIAESKDAMAQSQPLFKELKIERLYSDINVPYHEGALAYFRDKGITQAK